MGERGSRCPTCRKAASTARPPGRPKAWSISVNEVLMWTTWIWRGCEGEEEWGRSPALLGCPLLRPGNPRSSPHLRRETVAVHGVFRAGAVRGPPVQVQLQGPVLPARSQGQLQSRGQSQLH